MATEVGTTTAGGPAIPTGVLKRGLVVIVVIAFGIRLVAALHWELPPQTDAFDYDRMATSIANGDGYPPATVYSGGPSPSAFRPPLYPYLLAGVYELSGTSDQSARWRAGRVVEAVLGTAVVGLTVLIAFQLWGALLALIAGGIAAVYPPLVYAGTSLLTEPLFTALLLGGIAAVLNYRQRDPRVRWLAIAGVCAGLATLTRTNGVVAIAALALGAWTLRPRLSLPSAARPLLVVGVAALTIAPWTIRNAVELDRFVPVSTQTGFALAGEYNDIAAGDRATWVPAYAIPRYCPLFFDVPRCPLPGQKSPPPRELGEAEVGSRLTTLSREFALNHPEHIIAAGFWNGLRFLSLGNPVGTERSEAQFTGQPQGFAQFCIYAWWLLGLLAIGGSFTPFARRIPAFMWAIPALLLLSVVFVVATSRYRAPLEPIFVLLASCSLSWMWERIGWRGLRVRASG